MARRYARRGDRLYLVARDDAKLRALADELAPSVVGTTTADFDDTTRAASIVARANDELEGLDIAVLAHGALGDQIETEHSYDAAHATFTTNMLSAIALLIPLANTMEAAGHGHIAVMSSVAGERGRPRNYTYGAAKGALTIYLQGLRSRLWRRGVTVHTLKIGPVDTPMTVDHDKNALFSTADRVASDIVAKIDSRGGGHYVPWFWSPIMAVVRRLPEPIFQRIGPLRDR